MIDWSKEFTLIVERAAAYGVDPLFIAAIRHAENGGPGREFGVLSVSAPSYAEQLSVCCATVRHRLALSPINPFMGIASPRLRYSDEFISHFASIWAPSHADNDPTNLNANWATNVTNAYKSYILSGKPS
jgi:hypothetical protein